MNPDPKPKIDRQREHQANERTFLAWLRTSIALIRFGFAVPLAHVKRVRAFRFVSAPDSSRLNSARISSRSNLQFREFRDWIGSFWYCYSCGQLCCAEGNAARRYNQVLWQIESGTYRPSRLLIWVVTAVVMILGTLSIPPVLWRTKLPTSTTPMPAQPKQPR